jgi:hypothetical protein
MLSAGPGQKAQRLACLEPARAPPPTVPAPAEPDSSRPERAAGLGCDQASVTPDGARSTPGKASWPGARQLLASSLPHSRRSSPSLARAHRRASIPKCSKAARIALSSSASSGVGRARETSFEQRLSCRIRTTSASGSGEMGGRRHAPSTPGKSSASAAPASQGLAARRGRWSSGREGAPSTSSPPPWRCKSPAQAACYQGLLNALPRFSPHLGGLQHCLPPLASRTRLQRGCSH